MQKIDRSIQPKIKEIGNFSLPKPQKDILNNGIPVFTFQNENIDLIFIMLQIESGSLNQQKKHVCQYAYMLLRESSASFLPEEIAEKLDFYGTNITTNVGLDKIQITISVPKRNINEILPIICDFLINPKFRENSLNLYKEKEIKNLAYNEQKTDFLAMREMWFQLLCKSYPETFKKTTAETINSVTVSDLEIYHKNSFLAENIALFLTGDIDIETKITIFDNFNQIHNGTKAPKIENPFNCEQKSLIYEPMQDCMQSSILIYSESMGYKDKDRGKFSVLGTVLGGYFGSRLMQNLRERQGFTYGIFASSVFVANQSVFAISSDVNADDTKSAIEACFEEIKLLQHQPIDKEELETVKNYMVGLKLRSIDTSVNVMQNSANFYHHGLDETEMSRYISEIKNVTSEELLELAKKHFDYNKFNSIIVGKYCE